MNLRDVGGYAARGGSTRWRTLMRADALRRLNDASRARLAQLGLRQVVDLRSDAEVDRAPNALGRLPVTTTAVPVFPAAPPSAEGPSSLADIYRYIVDDRGESLARAVSALSEAGSLPAVVHRSAGKDRTGIVIALVLEVAGVDDSDIAADFTLTSRYLHPGNETAMRQLADGTGPTAVANPELLACPPELILQTLAHVRQAHGGAREYLLRHGTIESGLDQLTTALVQPIPDPAPAASPNGRL